MNAFAPSVMGSRDEAKRERRCGVCRPWVPGPPNISALSEARRHKGGRMWGMGICVFMGVCVEVGVGRWGGVGGDKYIYECVSSLLFPQGLILDDVPKSRPPGHEATIHHPE